MKETFEIIAEGYNLTPPNFLPPPDDIIEKVIKQIDRQIEIDKRDEINIFNEMFKS